MSTFDIDTYLARSGAVDLWAVDWADVSNHPLPPEAIRTLRYMQDIEIHTICISHHFSFYYRQAETRLPLATVRLLEAWREPFIEGGRNGYRSD